MPAAGGVNSSIGDMAVWMLAQMGMAPDVLPQPVLAAVQAPLANTPGETGRRRNDRDERKWRPVPLDVARELLLGR